MLHGQVQKWSSARLRPFAVVLVLVNVSLIILGAVWRHAAADDPDTGQAATPDSSAPSAQVAPSSVDSAEPELPAPLPASQAVNDPVMEELRKAIRDPESGLDVPRLDESSPLAGRRDARHTQDSSLRTLQRMKSLHALSTAALAVAREAHDLSIAGKDTEAAVLAQQASRLRKMIAVLAAEPESLP